MCWHAEHRHRLLSVGTILLLGWTGLLLSGCDGIGEEKDGYGFGCPPACENPIPRPVDRFPAWSPDSTRIAYYHIAQEKSERSGIWLLNLETDKQDFLVEGRHPTWHPDGNHLAFSRDRDIYRVDLRTDSVDRLTDCGACQLPAWSPDGNRIAFGAGEAFTNSEDSVGTWLMDPDGSNKEYLRLGGYRTWSPGGQYLALTVSTNSQGTESEIARFDLKSRRLEVLTDVNRVSARFPAWSPTGNVIAWKSLGEGEDPDWGIWIVEANGSNSRPLIREATHPSWSPDGSQLVFQYSFEEDHPALQEGQKVQTLGLADKDGSNVRPLTRLSDYIPR